MKTNPNRIFLYRKSWVVIDGNRLAREHQPVASIGARCKVRGAVHPRGEADLPRSLRCHPNYNHLVRSRAEDLAHIAGFGVTETCRCDGRIQVQLKPIVLDTRIRRQAARREIQPQIAQRLVARHALWNRKHVRRGQRLRLRDFAGEQ